MGLELSRALGRGGHGSGLGGWGHGLSPRRWPRFRVGPFFSLPGDLGRITQLSQCPWLSDEKNCPTVRFRVRGGGLCIMPADTMPGSRRVLSRGFVTFCLVVYSAFNASSLETRSVSDSSLSLL